MLLFDSICQPLRIQYFYSRTSGKQWSDEISCRSQKQFKVRILLHNLNFLLAMMQGQVPHIVSFTPKCNKKTALQIALSLNEFVQLQLHKFKQKILGFTAIITLSELSYQKPSSMAESHSIIQPKHPKRNNIQVSPFNVVFYNITIIYVFYLLLLLVFSTYLESVFTNFKIGYSRSKYFLIDSHLQACWLRRDIL